MKFLREYTIPGIIFGLLLLAGSCSENFSLTVDCDDCFDYRPDTADLIIYVTINAENPEVPIVLYRGNVEEGQVDYLDTVRSSPYHLPSAVDQFYSITAEYSVGDKKVIAVDGDEMKIKKEHDSCPPKCYIIKGGYLRLELKYDE